ncbi:MAG: copper chaperone PCu(A)C [Gammaproteobacteria bacterium]|nr:copper chaperone PCu(A)C [Gammaproteobacteria bacterium]MBL6998738.1 copper chaperone PCu(A)C [Gammaproteobacteria bacterium]
MKILSTLLLFLLTGSAQSAGIDVSFSAGWIKQLPPIVPMRAGYLQINNPSALAVSIVALHSDAFEKVEMHETMMADDMMKMIELDSILLPAKSQLELRPGGKHLMLINPLQTLNIGDSVPLQITFSDLTTQTTQLLIKK